MCAVLSAAELKRAVRIAAQDSGRTDILGARNLFSRHSRFHLIKLLETIALHAYATTI
jgi:hypothetical protein